MKNTSNSNYNKYSLYLRNLFGCRVQKVSLDAGFSCPNRDGNLATSGCIFCNNEAFNPPSRMKMGSLSQQLLSGISYGRKRFNARKFIAYFQSYTNTYGPIETLQQKYNIIEAVDDVVGLAIGTRPDCIDREKLDFINTYSGKYLVWLEYGLQSSHDTTLKYINRGHTYDDFLQAIELTSSYNIKICVHVILGLPGETPDDMILTAKRLANLPIDSVKIHVLHVLTGTPLEQQYKAGKVNLLERDQYVSLAVSFLECLPSSICIQRITADAHPPYLVAPDWITQKNDVLHEIDREFDRRGSQQGSACQE